MRTHKPMKNFFEQLEILKSKVTLSHDKKQDIRNALVSRIEADMNAGRVTRPATARPRFANLLFQPMPILASLVIIVLAGGGVSFAAENALPGDVFYAVKVGFNEKFVSAFAVNTEAKAAWSARVAERRLEEAAKLAAEGRANAETDATLAAAFEESSNAVAVQVKQAKAEGNLSGAITVTSRFEGILKAHEEILAKFKKKTDESSGAQVPTAMSFRAAGVEVNDDNEIDIKVQSALQNVSALRAELEGDVQIDTKSEREDSPRFLPSQIRVTSTPESEDNLELNGGD